MTKKSQTTHPGIYTITNKITGTVYVGQAIDITTRWARHRWTYRKNLKDTYLQRAWNKYGEENFIFSVYKRIEEPDIAKLHILLDKEEIAALAQFRSNCYNLKEAGISGGIISKETLKKLSEHNKQRWKNPEYRAKLSKLQKDAWERPGRKEARVAQYREAFKQEKYKKRRKELSKQMWAEGGVLRETQSAIRKANWKDPEYIAKQKESRKKTWLDPVIRKKRSEAIRAAWAKRKAKLAAETGIEPVSSGPKPDVTTN